MLERAKTAANLLNIVLANVASHFRESSEFNVFGRFSQGLCERVHSNETELTAAEVLDCDHRDDDATQFSPTSLSLAFSSNATST